MLRLSEILRDAYTDPDCSYCHSLTALLESPADSYFVAYESTFPWSAIYYRKGFDWETDSIRALLQPEHLAAYVFHAQRLALVTAAQAAQFRADTCGCGLTYLVFPSFAEKICCDVTDRYPFSEITWIDDDFLEDENAEFDFDAFYRIDKGEKYLNPKYVSVQEIMDFLTTPDMRCIIRRQCGEYISFETGEQQ